MHRTALPPLRIIFYIFYYMSRCPVYSGRAAYFHTPHRFETGWSQTAVSAFRFRIHTHPHPPSRRTPLIGGARHDDDRHAHAGRTARDTHPLSGGAGTQYASNANAGVGPSYCLFPVGLCQHCYPIKNRSHNALVPVKRHRGEPGHTYTRRSVRGTRKGHAGAPQGSRAHGSHRRTSQTSKTTNTQPARQRDGRNHWYPVRYPVTVATVQYSTVPVQYPVSRSHSAGARRQPSAYGTPRRGTRRWDLLQYRSDN